MQRSVFLPTMKITSLESGYVAPEDTTTLFMEVVAGDRSWAPGERKSGARVAELRGLQPVSMIIGASVISRPLVAICGGASPSLQ